MASPSTLHRSLELAGTLPALMVAADRVAATVIQGVHGRRRVGQGDAFWQYRPYRDGDSASQIDWRQSARSRHLFVRETEWEAAASVWLWRDASPSMQYASLRNTDTKAVRAELITLAAGQPAGRCRRARGRAGLGMRPTSGRVAVRRIAETLFDEARDSDAHAAQPAAAGAAAGARHRRAGLRLARSAGQDRGGDPPLRLGRRARPSGAGARSRRGRPAVRRPCEVRGPRGRGPAHDPPRRSACARPMARGWRRRRKACSA